MARKSTKKRLKEKFAKKNTPSTPKKEGKIASSKAKAGWYDKYYKSFLILPVLLLIIGLVVIFQTHAATGDYFYKGISLSGGTAVTITPDLVAIDGVETQDLRQALQDRFPTADIVVRSQQQLTERTALEVQVDITDETELEAFKSALVELLPGLTVTEINENSSVSGSSLGESFVQQIFQAMLIAFVLMGIVVFIQFKVPIPSLAVILAAFADIVVTLAIINLLGIKVSTAGIAAFLMLIGYSVDTDIMLSTRVLKNTEGTTNKRIGNAFKTGMTMSITTLAAVSIGLLVSQSAVISQIMLIIFIGLIVDIVYTWMLNASILKWYVERRKNDE